MSSFIPWKNQVNHLPNNSPNCIRDYYTTHNFWHTAVDQKPVNSPTCTYSALCSLDRRLGFGTKADLEMPCPICMPNLYEATAITEETDSSRNNWDDYSVKCRYIGTWYSQSDFIHNYTNKSCLNYGHFNGFPYSHTRAATYITP